MSEVVDRPTKCSKCDSPTPPAELFVFQDENLENELKIVQIESPEQLYDTGIDVFCGKCAENREAGEQVSKRNFQKISIEIASKSSTLEQQFQDLAFIDQENSIDYVIVTKHKNEQLPVIPAGKYLAKSENLEVWHRRKTELDDFDKEIRENRQKSVEIAENYAKIAMKTYGDLVARIKKDEIKKPREKEEIRQREEYHRATLSPEMLEKPRRRSQKSTTSRQSSSSETSEEPPKIDDVTSLMDGLRLRFSLATKELTQTEIRNNLSTFLKNAPGAEEDKLKAAEQFRREQSLDPFYPPN